MQTTIQQLASQFPGTFPRRLLVVCKIRLARPNPGLRRLADGVENGLDILTERFRSLSDLSAIVGIDGLLNHA